MAGKGKIYNVDGRLVALDKDVSYDDLFGGSSEPLAVEPTPEESDE